METLITGFLLAGFFCALFALAITGVYSLFQHLK